MYFSNYTRKARLCWSI